MTEKAGSDTPGGIINPKEETPEPGDGSATIVTVLIGNCPGCGKLMDEMRQTIGGKVHVARNYWSLMGDSGTSPLLCWPCVHRGFALLCKMLREDAKAESNG